MDMEVEETNPMAEACVEFATYLNVTRGAEAASDALLSLFLSGEQPDNPVEFVREHIDLKLNQELAKLKNELEAAQKELNELNEEIAELRKLNLIPNEDEEGIDEETEAEPQGDENDSESIGGVSKISKNDSESNKEASSTMDKESMNDIDKPSENIPEVVEKSNENEPEVFEKPNESEPKVIEKNE